MKNSNNSNRGFSQHMDAETEALALAPLPSRFDKNRPSTWEIGVHAFLVILLFPFAVSDGVMGGTYYGDASCNPVDTSKVNASYAMIILCGVSAAEMVVLLLGLCCRTGVFKVFSFLLQLGLAVVGIVYGTSGASVADNSQCVMTGAHSLFTGNLVVQYMFIVVSCAKGLCDIGPSK